VVGHNFLRRREVVIETQETQIGKFHHLYTSVAKRETKKRVNGEALPLSRRACFMSCSHAIPSHGSHGFGFPVEIMMTERTHLLIASCLTHQRKILFGDLRLR
jgi:hypothetical protein